MKQMSTLKNLLLAAGIASTSVASAQIHPLAFGPRPWGTATAPSNYYADYVGLRFLVSYPGSIAGPKTYTFAGDNTGTPWGAAVTSLIDDVPIVMAPLGGDTIAASGMTPGTMTGKIALVYRGGGIEFVCKALNAQAGGAIAVVIVNNVAGEPIPMGAGSACSAPSVTIPVFMITKADGDAIVGLYRSGVDTARFTITNWGRGLADDIGFVPEAFSGPHAYAIPSSQLGSSSNPTAYAMKNGAFIANYGTNTVTNVRLSTTTKFYAGGTGSGTTVHTSNIDLPTFTVADSVYAMFDTLTGEYDLSASGTGRFEVEYNLSHFIEPDGFEGDNFEKISFYVSDSVFSKGRYDFTKDEPVRSISYRFGETGDPFIWGPMYFVNNAGSWLKSIRYSVSSTATIPAGTPLGTTVRFFVFKWNDGAGGGSANGIVQDGEMELKSIGETTLSGVGDTSGASLVFRDMLDPTTSAPMAVALEAGSWYYIGIELGSGFFLGADGVTHPYPRIFGRAIGSGTLDYSSIVADNGGAIGTSSDPAGAYPVIPSSYAFFIGSVDTFSFANLRGLIPAVALVANSTSPVIDAVHEVGGVDTKVSVFPNPAKENMQVALQQGETSKKVTYTIVDGLGRFVSEEMHNNVKNETFNLNISKLASGNYYLVVSTDTKMFARKFVVVK